MLWMGVRVLGPITYGTFSVISQANRLVANLWRRLSSYESPVLGDEGNDSDPNDGSNYG